MSNTYVNIEQQVNHKVLQGKQLYFAIGWVQNSLLYNCNICIRTIKLHSNKNLVSQFHITIYVLKSVSTCVRNPTRLHYETVMTRCCDVLVKITRNKCCIPLLCWVLSVYGTVVVSEFLNRSALVTYFEIWTAYMVI